MSGTELVKGGVIHGCIVKESEGNIGCDLGGGEGNSTTRPDRMQELDGRTTPDVGSQASMRGRQAYSLQPDIGSTSSKDDDEDGAPGPIPSRTVHSTCHGDVLAS
jgi:hypothetical protein